MEKKPVKKPIKKPKKATQKQKQKQTVKVVVNVGRDGKPQMVRNPNPEIQMYAPNIYTRAPAIFSENAPAKPPIPPEPKKEPFRPRNTRQPYPNYFGVPPLPQDVFRPEYPESNRVEVLPDETEIINEITDTPYEDITGVVDEYNPETGNTDYIQTQIPTDFVNPLPRNLIQQIPDETEIINEITDTPYEDITGVIDEYNPETGNTDYIQSQNPTDFIETYNPTEYVNPLPRNSIEDTYAERERMIMGNEEINSKMIQEDYLKNKLEGLGMREEDLMGQLQAYQTPNVSYRQGLNTELERLGMREEDLMGQLQASQTPNVPYKIKNEAPSNMINDPEQDLSLTQIFKPLFTNLIPKETDNLSKPPKYVPNLYQETRENLRTVEAYKPQPIDENLIDELPWKRGGGLALSTLNMQELNRIAEIIGVRNTTGQGKNKSKAQLTADINYDILKRK